jgi:hypothetical protein
VRQHLFADAVTVRQGICAETSIRSYYQAYSMIRSITGYGAGNGPIIAMHEGFLGIAAWSGFLSGADRLALDQHPYLAFQATQNNNSWAQNVSRLLIWCSSSTWADSVRRSRRAVGVVGRTTHR